MPKERILSPAECQFYKTERIIRLRQISRRGQKIPININSGFYPKSNGHLRGRGKLYSSDFGRAE